MAIGLVSSSGGAREVSGEIRPFTIIFSYLLFHISEAPWGGMVARVLRQQIVRGSQLLSYAQQLMDSISRYHPFLFPCGG